MREKSGLSAYTDVLECEATTLVSGGIEGHVAGAKGIKRRA